LCNLEIAPLHVQAASPRAQPGQYIRDSSTNCPGRLCTAQWSGPHQQPHHFCRNSVTNVSSEEHPLDQYFRELIRRRRIIAAKACEATANQTIVPSAALMLESNFPFNESDVHNLIAVEGALRSELGWERAGGDEGGGHMCDGDDDSGAKCDQNDQNSAKESGMAQQGGEKGATREADHDESRKHAPAVGMHRPSSWRGRKEASVQCERRGQNRTCSQEESVCASSSDLAGSGPSPFVQHRNAPPPIPEAGAQAAAAAGTDHWGTQQQLLTEVELLSRVADVKCSAGSKLSVTARMQGTLTVDEEGGRAPRPECLQVVRRAFSFSECESGLAHGQLAEVRAVVRPNNVQRWHCW
jgi:hypothetical protein